VRFAKTFLPVFILLIAWTGLNAEIVRVASFNVRNYNVCDHIIDGIWTPKYPKPEEEKTALRTILRAVNPDVVVFQEMGPSEFLEELRHDLAKEGLDYPYSAHMVALDEDRCLCALSRIPFAGVTRHTDLTYSVSKIKHGVKRGLLALSFSTQGRAWTLYDAHLKSRYGSDKDPVGNRKEREGEAMAIRNRIAKDANNGFWMLAGDMNDTPGTGTWRKLSRKYGKPLGVDLRPLDSNGEPWTYNFASRDIYERIDMLLCSTALSNFIVEGSAHIYDGPGANEASDHRLVYMELNFPDVPEAEKE